MTSFCVLSAGINLNETVRGTVAVLVFVSMTMVLFVRSFRLTQAGCPSTAGSDEADSCMTSPSRATVCRLGEISTVTRCEGTCRNRESVGPPTRSVVEFYSTASIVTVAISL